MVDSDERVEYDIIIKAAEAMQQLLQLTTTASTFKEKIDMVNASLRKFSQETGMSMKAAASTFKEIDGLISDTVDGSALFGNMQKQGWMEVENGASKAVRGIDAVRIALGALVAMVVFNVIQAFQNLFGGAIKGLRELETATYNLANAEKTLSEQGIGITPQDLDNIISRLQKLDPLLSKIQASELVSSIATRVAPQVGFNKDQIQQLSEAIAVLAIRNKGLGKSFEEVEKQVTDAFLTGKVSVAINNLGVKINDQIVKDEALRLGLVKTADEFDNLTGKMEANIKAQALLSLISQNANKDLSHLPDYFKTADAAFGIFQARLQDILTKIGTLAGPLLQQIFIDLATLLGKVLDYLEKNSDTINQTWIPALMAVAKAVVFIANGFLSLGEAIATALGKFERFATKANPILKKFGIDLQQEPAVDTPTGVNPNTPNKAAEEQTKINKAVAEGQSKLQDILKDSADKKLDIERDYGRKLEDIATNYSQKLEDIARNTAEKREDALRNYNDKVEDINRDANQKIVDARTEEQKKQIDREAQFQQRLKELREKFLFDLEDALRARDARQVLRLIRQYNMDKQNLEDRHKLEQQQAKKDLAQKLADIEYERQKKLEAAKREYEDKLKEIQIGEQRALAEAALWRRRQLEDARIWHQRQLQEQREYLQRKLRDLADAIKKEYQLTATGAQAITNLLAAAYGNYASVLSQFGNGLTPVASNGALTGGSLSPGNTFANFANTFANLTSGHGYGLAEGGTLLATRPTKAMFGERGPEAVTVTPLDKIGNNVNKTFGDRSAMGANGNVKIALELSPDLEARIIESSMDGVAVTLEKINRSK